MCIRDRRQRVGIAMAMTFSPKLLIADEPTSALDVTTQSQIIRNMLELREKFNTGIIMVTHNLAIAAYISDKIIVMKDGKIVEQGSRDNIINNPKDEYTKAVSYTHLDVYKRQYTNFGKKVAVSSDAITIGQFAKLLRNNDIVIGRN